MTDARDTESADEELLGAVRAAWQHRDPVPEGLVARMQSMAALAAADTDLDIELMLLVERTEELAGARGGGGTGTAYTLRFVHAGVDLLLRVTSDREGLRIDGWLVPPQPLTVRVLRGDTEGPAVAVGESGRFELTDLAAGVLRLRLDPHDGNPPFMTPAFEL